MVYIKTHPHQTQLLPTDLRDIIVDGHVCYLVEELVDNMDFLEYDKEVSGRGTPSYHPRIKIKILVYGVLEKVTSSRRLEKLIHENIIYRYLAEGANPDFHTLSMFRKSNAKLIEECFLRTVVLAKEMGLVNVNKLYLDGTKIQANASKSKNFSEEELNFLSEYLKNHLKKMDQVEEEEDKMFGSTNGEILIPEHLRNKSKLRETIRTYMRNPENNVNKIEDAKSRSTDSERKNLTDPDSRLMKMKNSSTFKQAYNCQILVEDKNELIVSIGTYNDPTDVGLLIPFLKRYSQTVSQNLEGIELNADNGFMSTENIRFLNENSITAHIPTQSQTQIMNGKSINPFHVEKFILDLEKNEVTCPEGQSLYFEKKRTRKRKENNVIMNVYSCHDCEKCKSRKLCIKGHSKFKEVEISPEMRKFSMNFLDSDVQEKYSKRFHKGEVAQAHILHNLGYREFKMRSNDSVQIEMNLAAIAYNLTKLRKIKASKGGYCPHLFGAS